MNEEVEDQKFGLEAWITAFYSCSLEICCVCGYVKDQHS